MYNQTQSEGPTSIWVVGNKMSPSLLRWSQIVEQRPPTAK
jgi:hypothetical protein